mmetsp:Transcript_22401/g.68803  ORF Transcript_22401/g.68803 Transcript_22401/m.68803 type:complete len:437 (+) Transcript_22401:134-1444(+)
MDLFSQAQVDALRRLKDAFEQKLLDEDEYKAEKAKVLNATPAAAPAPAEDDFELVGVQTPAERAAESRRRAEAEGNVVEIDDDEPAAPAPPPPARKKPAARPDARPTPRHEEPVMLRCRRVYFGTALRRDVTVVFAPSCVTMEWRSDTSGLYIETRLAPSHMTSFDLYHGPARGAGGDGEANPINLADDDEMAPDAIREFFAIGLRQKPPHLRSVEGFEPTDDAGPRKYVVVVLDGEALATFKREAVPAVVWGGHVGWPAAPVLGTAAAAREFLEGVSVVDAALRGAALRNSLCEAPSARGNMLLKSQAARAIMDDPLLREAAIAGTLTRKMVRKALIARSDTCATEIEVMILKMRRSFKDDIKAGIRTAAKILRTQARQARRLCDVCGGRGPLDREAFPSCGGCGARRYCSGVCQRDDWVAGGHSSVCPWCPNEL